MLASKFHPEVTGILATPILQEDPPSSGHLYLSGRFNSERSLVDNTVPAARGGDFYLAQVSSGICTRWSACWKSTISRPFFVNPCLAKTWLRSQRTAAWPVVLAESNQHSNPDKKLQWFLFSSLQESTKSWISSGTWLADFLQILFAVQTISNKNMVIVCHFTHHKFSHERCARTGLAELKSWWHFVSTTMESILGATASKPTMS